MSVVVVFATVLLPFLSNMKGSHVRALHMLWKITIITNLLLAVWRHGPEEGIFLDIISIELLNFIPSPVSDTDLLPENRPSLGNGCVLWSRLQDLVRNVPESDSSYMTNKSKKNLHNFVIYLTGNKVFLTAWHLCKVSSIIKSKISLLKNMKPNAASRAEMWS